MTAVAAQDVAEAVGRAHRTQWAQVVAATVRVAHDLDLAEECAQEAYAHALVAWRDGVPDSPGGWLTTVARRRAVDALRRAAALRRKLPLLVEPERADGTDDGTDDGDPELDDRLRLLFTCCHPALAPDARVALTTRLVCGVPTPDVARAFLVPEATMAARVTRAKKKIAAARIPFRMPAPADLPARLDSVLACIHVLYAAGHTAPRGDRLVQDDVTGRAVDLARTLVDLLPREPEAAGLLALVLLGEARRPARTDGTGALVVLEEQDRSCWDPLLVAEGLRLVAAALAASPSPGRFTLQAAVAGVHTSAPTFEATDWPRVVALYDRLLRVWDSPVVALNRAAAVGFRDGAEAGLDAVGAVAGDARLAGYPYLPAARADLLRRLGRYDEATAAYEEALALSANEAERAYLRRRVAEVRTAVTAVTSGGGRTPPNG